MRAFIVGALLVLAPLPAAASAFGVAAGWTWGTAAGGESSSGLLLGMRMQYPQSLRERLEFDVFREQTTSHGPSPPGTLVQSSTGYGLDAVWTRLWPVSYRFHPWFGAGILYAHERIGPQYQTDQEGYLTQVLPNRQQDVWAGILQIERARSTSWGRVGLVVRLELAAKNVRFVTLLLTLR